MEYLPVAQEAQLSAPSVMNDCSPAAQAMHAVEPATGACCPFTQSVHSVDGSVSASAAPAAHGTQATAASSEYSPTEQDWHEVVASLSWSFCPGEHSVHSSPPPANVPGWHGKHAVLRKHADEEQLAHSVPLVVFEPWPGEQSKQLTSPGVAMNCPGEHSTHSVDGSLSASLFPGSQSAQNVDGVLWLLHEPTLHDKHDVARAWSL